MNENPLTLEGCKLNETSFAHLATLGVLPPGKQPPGWRGSGSPGASWGCSKLGPSMGRLRHVSVRTKILPTSCRVNLCYMHILLTWIKKIRISLHIKKGWGTVHTFKQTSRVNVNCVSTTWENRIPATLHWDWLKWCKTLWKVLLSRDNRDPSSPDNRL